MKIKKAKLEEHIKEYGCICTQWFDDISIEDMELSNHIYNNGKNFDSHNILEEEGHTIILINNGFSVFYGNASSLLYFGLNYLIEENDDE